MLHDQRCNIFNFYSNMCKKNCTKGCFPVGNVSVIRFLWLTKEIEKGLFQMTITIKIPLSSHYTDITGEHFSSPRMNDECDQLKWLCLLLIYTVESQENSFKRKIVCHQTFAYQPERLTTRFKLTNINFNFAILHLVISWLVSFCLAHSSNIKRR